MRLYGLKNCDSCRKALKELDGAGRNVEFHDVRDEGVSTKQISIWAKSVGWEKLLNTRSTTWRGLTESQKENVDQTKAIALMAENPTLIKRPIIENGPTQVFVGWSKETQAALLK